MVSIPYSHCTTDTETVRTRSPSSPSKPATPIILATPHHNNSVVQWWTDIRNGPDRIFEISSTASLVVRGESIFSFLITVLTHLIVAPNTIIVTWNALPSTEYCVTEYCVNITRTTLNSTETVVFDSVFLCVDWLMSTSSCTPTPVCVTDSPSLSLLLKER